MVEMRRVLAISALVGCGTASRPEPPDPEMPPASSGSSARPGSNPPKRELAAPDALEGAWINLHFGWYSEAGEAATALGTACRNASQALLAENFAPSLQVCLAACDEDAASCVIAAGWLMDSIGNEAEDRDRALELYERACASTRDPMGCFILGEQLDRGEHVAHDPKLARAAWRRGCAQGEPLSCAALEGNRLEVTKRVIAGEE
jgi:hypothetical protein